MIILIAIIIPINTTLFIIYLKQRFTAGTEINNLMTIIYICIGGGIYFDCYKFLSIIIFKTIDFNVLIIGFVAKTTLLLFCIVLAFQVIAIYNKQIGSKIKYEGEIRVFYYVLFIFFTFFNIPTYSVISGIEFGHDVILMNQFLYFIIPLSFVPLGFFMIMGIKPFIHGIKNNKLKMQFLSLATFFVLLTLERYFFNLIYYFGYYDYVFVSIGDLFVVLLILTGYLIIVVNDTNVLDAISIYFAVKTFYIIKDNGQTIFSYHFQQDNEKTPLTREELMLGGFIYTIASGLAHTLKTEEKVKKIKIKDTQILLEYGNKIFGVLIVTEISKLIADKFDQLMVRFEGKYKAELEEWTGEISKFDIKLIEKWIKEIFGF